ncbi:MAG: class I SAM-dependent methyltransferase [Chloroflexi bacterium]|nr:class I SAM-dependent methyltransferase [Chloroflexota bacterium]
MSRAELEKWETRYTAGEFTPNDRPSALLAEWLPHLPRGRALDVACGPGRNALFLARHGYTVDAIDISSAALEMVRRKATEEHLSVNCIQADLDVFASPFDTYDLIVVNFYLNRVLAPKLVGALKTGGVLLFEHHGLSDAGTVPMNRDAPTDPQLRLKPGELRSLFRGLCILHYSEGPVLKDGELVPLAQLVARKEVAPRRACRNAVPTCRPDLSGFNRLSANGVFASLRQDGGQLTALAIFIGVALKYWA